MSILKTYCKKYKFQILFMIILKTIGTLLELFLPWAFAYMVNEIVPKNSQAAIIEWGFVMLGIAISTLTFSLIVSNMNARFGVKVSKQLREDVFSKTLSLDNEQIDEFGTSSLVSRLTTDITYIQQFITKMMTKGVHTIVFFVGSLSTAVIMDTKLATIMFAVIPFIAITVYLTTVISFKKFKEVQSANDKMFKSLRENVIGIRVIRALSKFTYEKERFNGVNTDLYEKNISASFVNIIGAPTMKLFLNIGMVAVLLLGAYWVNTGQSNSVTLVVFMSYFTSLLMSLISIGQLFTMSSKAAASSSRIAAVLNAESRIYEESNETFKSKHHIEFRNVSFNYPKTKDGLDNVSFAIKKGETLGIIGPTASGKSTVINLLLRLYEPTSGEILIDGKPLNTFSQETLYKIFGVVFQSDVVFSDSVKNNISFGRDIEEQNIKSSAKAAQADYFINKLSNKYDSLLNIRGQNLSGGEKQRLLISRALAGNPQVLVLDDSTSALDYKTDARLRRELARNHENSTKILISQRVASIIDAQQIIVLDKGKILSKGTHYELMNSCELYKKIGSSQLGDSKLYA